MNDTPEMKEFEEKFNEVMGLETDPQGIPNMFLIRDAEEEIQEGIDFGEERELLKKWITDNFLPKSVLRKFVEERMKLLAQVTDAKDARRSIEMKTYGYGGHINLDAALSCGEVRGLDSIHNLLDQS